MQELELDLDVYQGPFDLLFTLILREEVDIFEVPLLEIILAYLEGAATSLPTLDWEGLSEFLVLISSLLELKSRFLLPGQEVGEEALDPEQAREMLLARLLTYQKFKAAALFLRNCGMEQRGRLVRDAARRHGRSLTLLEDVQASRDPAELARAVDKLLEARKGPDTSHMPVVRVELARQIATVRRLLENGAHFSFERTFGQEPAAVQAVTLFALLELLARGEVRVNQARPFGDITVRAREARQIA